MTQKIKAVYMYEMLGKPPEYLKESLEQYIDKLKEVKGIKLLNKTVHEPHPIDDEKAKDLYTTFAEAELEIDDINTAFGIVFFMLPSHIEILEPSDIKLRNSDFGGLLSDLAVRIHKYDEITKGLILENNSLKGKINEIQQKIMQAQARTNQALPLKITTTMSGADSSEKAKRKDEKKKSENKKSGKMKKRK